MTRRSLVGSGSAPKIQAQNPRCVAGSLKWMNLIRSTACPICRVIRMSIVIQTISSEQAITARDLTGRRNENIQRISWRLLFSGSVWGAEEGCPSFAGGDKAGGDGGLGADEAGGGD